MPSDDPHVHVVIGAKVRQILGQSCASAAKKLLEGCTSCVDAFLSEGRVEDEVQTGSGLARACRNLASGLRLFSRPTRLSRCDGADDPRRRRCRALEFLSRR